MKNKNLAPKSGFQKVWKIALIEIISLQDIATTTITIVKNSNKYLASTYDGDAAYKTTKMANTIVELTVGDTVSF